MRTPFISAGSIAFVAVFLTSCGGHQSGPGSPTPALSGPIEVTGSLVDQNTRAIAGATVTFTQAGQATVTTDANGRFSISVASGGLDYRVEATGFVTRRSRLSVTTSRDSALLDVIALVAPFSLQFYREFVRNGHESSTLRSTRPWTVPPSFYIRIRAADSGIAVPAALVDAARSLITASIPELTGNRLTIGTFETGDEERPLRDGWVNISFVEDSSVIGGNVGTASVGGNSGSIRVVYDPSRDADQGQRLGCDSLTLWGLDHEIVHTMGFWHTSRDGAEFHSGGRCSGVDRPEIARYHASIMYSRPALNADPDTDPPGYSKPAAAARESQLTVSCQLPPGFGSTRLSR